MSILATASSSSDAFAETTLVWSGWGLNTCFLLHSFFFSDSRGHEMAGTPPWGPLGSESFPALCTSGFLLKLSQWVKHGLSWWVHLSWNTFEAHSYFLHACLLSDTYHAHRAIAGLSLPQLVNKSPCWNYALTSHSQIQFPGLDQGGTDAQSVFGLGLFCCVLMR